MTTPAQKQTLKLIRRCEKKVNKMGRKLKYIFQFFVSLLAKLKERQNGSRTSRMENGSRTSSGCFSFLKFDFLYIPAYTGFIWLLLLKETKEKEKKPTVF